MSKNTISFILVIIDIIAIYIFWIFLQHHGKYEYLEEREIDGEVLNGSDFAVMIKNLPRDQDPRVLKSKLWQHLERVLEEYKHEYVKVKDAPNATLVADINFGMSDYGIMHFYLKRSSLMREEAVITIKTNILNDTEMDEDVKEKQIRKLEKKLVKVQKKKEKNEREYEKFKQKNKQQVVKAFVTFKSTEAKLRIMQLYHVSRLTKIFGKKKLKDRYFENKWLDVRHPTDPSLILWENLGVSMTQRCIRIFIVAAISVLLMIFTFAIIVYSRYYQSSLSEKYGSSSCPSDKITQEEAYADYMKPQAERSGLMNCYCSQEYKSMAFNVKNIVFSNGEKYCEDWLLNYSVNNALIWCMVIVMSMINVALKVGLRIISVFERRHDKTDLVISNTFKMFFVQF